tara:strand:- start:348 stop:524 length:177 start_codon:yes stop_codon:yes gene_type:complete
MPFEIVKKQNGFVVRDVKTGETFSKKPLTKQKAMRQRIAIAISEHKQNPEKPMRYFFA